MKRPLGENENRIREAVCRKHQQTFSFADRYLAVAHQLHTRLCRKSVPESRERAKGVVVALWTKTCNQYRAVLVLCEMGLTDDAEIIARSLFETGLWTLFIAKKNLRRRRGWKSAPSPPHGGFSMQFRAELYLARIVLEEQKRVNVCKQIPGCKRTARRLAAAVDEMLGWSASHIGEPWMDWFKNRETSGDAFKIERMAENVGLGDWYACVYRAQSSIVHAGDPARHIEAGEEPMTVDVRLEPDIVGAARPIQLVNALIGRAMEVVNGRFGLEMEKIICDLAKDWKGILGQA